MMTKIKSALVSSVLMAVLSIAVYVISVGDIYQVSAHILVNTGVMALLAGIVSFIKASLTDANGMFGGVQVK